MYSKPKCKVFDLSRTPLLVIETGVPTVVGEVPAVYVVRVNYPPLPPEKRGPYITLDDASAAASAWYDELLAAP
jgi:hypothetical protein